MSDQITEPQVPEVEVDDAFADAIDELMKEEAPDDTDNEDTPAANTPEPENVDQNVDPEPSGDNVHPDDNTVIDPDPEPSVPSEPELDYKALYEQALASSAAQNAQIDNLVEQKFNSWRGRVEEEERLKAAQAAAAAASAAPSRQLEPMEVTDEMKEVFEMYPDLLPQIQTIVDGRVLKEVSGVEDRVAQLIEQRVTPIQDHVQQSELSATERAVTAKHPDIHQRIASGEFRQWVETLPAYQQAGAQFIVNQGTADEVIGLFDSFKAAVDGKLAAPAAPASAPKSPKQNSAPAPAAAPAPPVSDNVVDRVKDAMSVPAAPAEVPTGTPAEPSDPEEYFLKISRELMQEEAIQAGL